MTDGMSFLTGEQVDAEYQESVIPWQRDNPLIAALPPRRSAEAFTNLMRRGVIGYCPEQRALSDEDRFQLIRGIVQFFEPLPTHVDVAITIEDMLRNGYVGRNPLIPRVHCDRAQLTPIQQALVTLQDRPRLTSNSHVIIGSTGTGKTTILEEVLHCFPQVIRHSEYQGRPFFFTQIVWLKLDVPHDISLKTLQVNWFKAVSQLVEKDLVKAYGISSKSDKTIGTMAPDLSIVANNYKLGLMVYDELQNLNAAHSGGYEKMTNFFVSWPNNVQVPDVYSGTYKARDLLQNSVRLARRTAGQGAPDWPRLKPDKTWRFFLEALWDYQFVRIPSPLDDDLCATMYNETQGIMDLVIKLFILAQVRAILSHTETLTPGILHETALFNFTMLENALLALRNGVADEMALARFDDLGLDLEEQIQAEQLRRQKEAEKRRKRTESATPNVATEQSGSELPVTVPENTNGPADNLGDNYVRLPDLISKCEDSDEARYQALLQAGLTRGPDIQAV